MSAPPSFNTAAAGIEALWRGWSALPELDDILDCGHRSVHPLIGLAATLGRIHRRVHRDDDFAYVTKIGDRKTISLMTWLLRRYSPAGQATSG